MIRLLAVVGPTAAGKTGLAVDLAHDLGSEIVSVDSRQVYRGLDIGTGKDLHEYRRTRPPVRVHMVDVADPADVYSVFHYQRDCYRVLEEAAGRRPFSEGTPMVMAGGTGLYLEAVLRGFRIADVAEDPALRARLMDQSVDGLIERLRKEDQRLARQTDLSSKKRVVRALEIAAHAKRGPVRYSDPPPVRMEPRVFAIAIGREELHRRIDRRLRERLEEGMVEEVRRLIDGGLPASRMRQLGLEYREVTAYLLGEKTFEQMVEDLRRGIHRFAKRQQTWFRGIERRGLAVTWISPGDREGVLKTLL